MTRSRLFHCRPCDWFKKSGLEIGPYAEANIDGEGQERRNHNGRSNFKVDFEKAWAPKSNGDADGNAGKEDGLVAQVVPAIGGCNQKLQDGDARPERNTLFIKMRG